jgi:hypothetical protein
MSKEKRLINTNGGAYIEGNVFTEGGDFIGRDQLNLGFNEDEIMQFFQTVSQKFDDHQYHSEEDKSQLKRNVDEVQKELLKREQAKSSFIIQRLKNIWTIAPDIFEVIISFMIDPKLGCGMVISKIATKAKKEIYNN